MTPHQVELVQASFAGLAPRADAVASLFYEHLFALDPTLRRMFPPMMAEQRRKLMTMLAVAVQGPSRPETILPAVQALGRRHAGYGVEAHHYATVGKALLATLGEALGAGLDGSTAAAWADCYDLLAQVMSEAATPAMAA